MTYQDTREKLDLKNLDQRGADEESPAVASRHHPSRLFTPSTDDYDGSPEVPGGTRSPPSER